MLFTGCSFGGTADSMLSPPKLSETQEAVYKALVSAVGSDIKLVYPRYGEYRSAFLFSDLDGDGEEEAAVFYENDRDTESSVRINVIDSDGKGGYRSVYDHAGAGTGIERVFFTDFGTGRTRMAVGYTYMTPTEKTLRLYGYSNGILDTEYSESYYRAFMTDLDRDGKEDAVIVNCNTDNHQAYVSLIGDSGSGAECRDTVMLDPETTELPSIVNGGLTDGVSALFIDGIRSGGSISTEIVYCVDGSLRNPAYLAGSDIPASTMRQNGLYCMDADGDGIIEIPTTEPFTGYTNASGGERMTVWNVYENYDIIRKYSTYTDLEGSWSFVLPNRWEGLVTVKTDSTTGEKVFCKFNASAAESRLELMRITSVSESGVSRYTSKGYKIMGTNDGSCVMLKFGDTDDNLLLTESEAANNMMILKR